MMKTIDYRDREAADEVLALAYAYLQDTLQLPGESSDIAEVIGKKPLCIDASSSTTRAAQDLGIIASREGHGICPPVGLAIVDHYLTSFAPLGQYPRETDTIMCLTWGQFDAEKFQDYRRAYFGPRVGILELVGVSKYRNSYSASSVILRQVTHTPSPRPSMGHVWLDTRPGDLVNGVFPVGQVDADIFYQDTWGVPRRTM